MALTISLTLSANGANIPGDSTATSLGRENTIEVTSLDQTVSVSFERATMRATGRRIYMPLRFTKVLDRSTPLLRQALAHNEVVEGNFRWFRPNPSGDGTTEHYLTLSFTEGRVSKCALRLPDTLNPDTESLPAMEEVELVAGSFTWTWESAGITFTDTVSRAV